MPEAHDSNPSRNAPKVLAGRNERVSGWHAAVVDSDGALLGPWFWASTKEGAVGKAQAHYEAVGSDPPTFFALRSRRASTGAPDNEGANS